MAADHSLIPRAIEEMLRDEAPSPVQARYVAHDVECRGQTIQKGSVMLLINGSANRDDRHFADPDRFDIHRNGAHLCFGQGLHFCLGSALARMQARVVLEEVVAVARVGRRLRRRRKGAHCKRARVGAAAGDHRSAVVDTANRRVASDDECRRGP